MNLLLAFVLTAAVLTSGSIVKPPGENFELLILHNNDMHARFEQTSQLSGACTTADREAGKCYGGFPRVAHVVKEARRAAQTGEGPPVLYLNAGDTYTGTAWFTIYKWKIAAEFINALQPDAVCLGNHEFDNGVVGIVPFIKNLSFPVLTSNLVLNKTPELANLPNLKKSVVLEVAGKKIGVVGYLTPDTKEIAVPNDVDYVDEIEAIRKEVSRLKNEGIRIIIALGHSGYLKDLEIARKVEGIDLVIGGHSHSFLWNGTSPDSEEPQGPYPTYAVQASGKSVPVVQAYAFTKYIGQIHLLFDSNGDLINVDGAPILLDNTIPQDPDMLKMVNKYRANLHNITEEVIGYTSVVLDRTNCVFMECNLGNLITDGMVFRYAVNYTGEHWTDAPIAVIQSGGIRASLAHATKPANITKGDLLTILPFGGTLVTVAMNGSVLREMIEYSIKNFNNIDTAGPFLQFSGLKVTYNINKPAGSRLVKVEARCWSCDVPSYSKVIDKEIYKVLMTSFVAMGGDGFGMFKGLPMETLGYNEVTSTQYYITRHSPIYPEVEGRITLLSNDTEQINTNNSASTKWSSSIPVLIALFNLLSKYNFFY